MKKVKKTREGIQLDRRTFLKGAALGIAGTALPSGNADASFWESFFQKHFQEMNEAEIKQVIERLEKEYGEKYKKAIMVGNEKAIPGVLFGYGLDLSRCIGCRRCEYACVDENNQSKDPQIHWITVLRFKKGEKWVDLEESEKYYNPDLVPEPEYFYMPVQCQQCENPPCMAACPYGARHFNWTEPNRNPEEINPKTHYLGNRPRYKGVVEKCTFCIQRTRNGRYPACVEACPVGARKFGNLLDPNSEIRYAIEHKRVFRLKEDLNTYPKFYYFFAYGV